MKKTNGGHEFEQRKLALLWISGVGAREIYGRIITFKTRIIINNI
jgi:hypothetical protein